MLKVGCSLCAFEWNVGPLVFISPVCMVALLVGPESSESTSVPKPVHVKGRHNSQDQNK